MNAAGNVIKSIKASPDDKKSCGAKIHNKTIPQANDNYCGEVTPEKNREQLSATDNDDE